MANCPKCQRPVVENAKFCTHCGATIETAPPVGTGIFCTNCGNRMDAISRFCNICGTPVTNAQAPQEIEQPPAEPVAVTYAEPYTATPVPAKKKGKGGLIAAIIALVLVVALGVSWVMGAFDGLFEDDRRTSSSRRDDEDEDEDPTEEAPTEEEEESTEPPVVTEDVTLRIWAPSYDVDWVCAMVDEFNATHPEYNLTVIVETCSENDAGSVVSSDPMGAADIYMYTNDQVGRLVESGALSPLEGSFLAQVETDNSDSMIHSVTHTDGSVYGFPYASNTWFMYYDKSVFSETDIRSLETMLEKGVVAIPVNNSWYLASFYVAGGATFYGPNGNDPHAGIQLTNGTTITNYLVDLVAHPNFRNEEYNSGIAGIQDGTVNAFFSGYWYASSVEAALGDNMGVAPVPTITVDGQQLQPQPFAGSKAIGVNPYCDNQEAAMAFAAFLATPEAQLSRYEFNGTAPAAPALLQNPVIANDPVVAAQLMTVQNCSILQPSIPEMANYWEPASNMGNAIVQGIVTHSNAAEYTVEFEAAINP